MYTIISRSNAFNLWFCRALQMMSIETSFAQKPTTFAHRRPHAKIPCEVHVTQWKMCVYFRAAKVRLALTVTSYSTSLNAKRKAAVSTLWVTFGPIPDQASQRKSIKTE